METETNYKYIVYETINKQNSKIYVGVHKTLNPDIFDGYIGCGVYVNQPSTYNYPKTAFQYAVKKYGPAAFVRKTLKVFMTEIEASDLERQIVDYNFIKRDDVYNMVLGGINNIGESTRIPVYRYDLNGNFISEFNSLKDAAAVVECDYTAISSALRFKGSCRGYYWTYFKTNTINVDDFKIWNPNQKIVYLYDLSGKFITSFDNMTKCGEYIGVSTSEITQAVYGGYCIRKKYYVCFIKDISFDKARKIYTKTRKIFQYDEFGIFLNEFEHQFEAENKYPDSNIDKAIRLKKQCKNNYFWSVIKLSNFNIKETGCKSSKEVYKYTLDNKLVAVYKSKTETSKIEGSGVWQVIDKLDRTHKGHKYTTYKLN